MQLILRWIIYTPIDCSPLEDKCCLYNEAKIAQGFGLPSMAVNSSCLNEGRRSSGGIRSTSEIRVWTPTNQSPPPARTSLYALCPSGPLSDADIEPVPSSSANPSSPRSNFHKEPAPTSSSAFVHPSSMHSNIHIEPAPVSPGRPVVRRSTDDRFVKTSRPKPPERRTTLETAYVYICIVRKVCSNTNAE